jgi:hypothetical protein
VDVYGVPGVDGTDQHHEFEDGRAARVAGATASDTWVKEEWSIDNDSGAGNGALDAPNGYDPKAGPSCFRPFQGFASTFSRCSRGKGISQP